MWGACLFVVCLCLPRVVVMLCVCMHDLVLHWSVRRSELHPITYTSVIGINIYVHDVCWLFLHCSYYVH